MLGLSPALVAAAVGVCIATAFAGALAARLTRRRPRADERSPGEQTHGAARPEAALAASVPRFAALAVQRPRLLADRPHRVLGRREPGLEPDALALGRTCSSPRRCCGSARRCCSCDCAGRVFAWLARRVVGGRAATTLPVPARERRAPWRRDQPRTAVVGLLLAFGVNLGVFAATYDQQARVDAQLTLGADVVVTAPPGRSRSTRPRAHDRARLRRRRRPRRSTILRVRRARPPGHVRDRPARRSGRRRASATRTSSAAAPRTMLDRLRATPDGDPRLQGDDHRLLAAHRRPAEAARARPPQRPIPVAPLPRRRQSCRSSRRRRRTRSWSRTSRTSSASRTIPARTSSSSRASGDPVAVARASPRRRSPLGTRVKNIRQQTAQTVSSITTVDLRGISRIEEAFVLVLAAAAMALFVAVGLAERRHELATMAALGASLRRVAAFLWSEAVLVLAAALALAAVLGWLLARDARRDAPARLRPAARPARGALGVPRRARGAAAVAGGRARRRCSRPRLPLGAILLGAMTERAVSCGQRILVVEDDDELRGVLARGLREEGFDVEAVATGAELLRPRRASARPTCS